ncbi:hypothetical protein HMPREF0880_04117 [Yokenella regensburgei ATCC 43003]|nr:hypothetical protein HMPREF0880_04117 [Yokenella regensburgei ATCC 43003]
MAKKRLRNKTDSRVDKRIKKAMPLFDASEFLMGQITRFFVAN